MLSVVFVFLFGPMGEPGRPSTQLIMKFNSRFKSKKVNCAKPNKAINMYFVTIWVGFRIFHMVYLVASYLGFCYW